MVVARPEINSVKELKGKTVAVAAIGSANFAVLQLMAKHFGLDPEKEIKVLVGWAKPIPPRCTKTKSSGGGNSCSAVGFSCEEVGFSCDRQKPRVVYLSSNRPDNQ